MIAPRAGSREITMQTVSKYGATADAEAQARADAAPLVLPLSKHDLVSAATALICEAWGLDAAKVRLWDYWEEMRFALLDDDDEAVRVLGRDARWVASRHELRVDDVARGDPVVASNLSGAARLARLWGYVSVPYS